MKNETALAQPAASPSAAQSSVQPCHTEPHHHHHTPASAAQTVPPTVPKVQIEVVGGEQTSACPDSTAGADGCVGNTAPLHAEIGRLSREVHRLHRCLEIEHYGSHVYSSNISELQNQLHQMQHQVRSCPPDMLMSRSYIVRKSDDYV